MTEHEETAQVSFLKYLEVFEIFLKPYSISPRLSFIFLDSVVLSSFPECLRSDQLFFQSHDGLCIICVYIDMGGYDDTYEYIHTCISISLSPYIYIYICVHIYIYMAACLEWWSLVL